MKTLPVLLSCWLAVVMAGTSTGWGGVPVAGADAPDRLTLLVIERLEVARRVAWVKYHDGLPVLDAERERVVLAERVTAGGRLGLAPERVGEFFGDQMAASRAEQAAVIRLWSRGAPLPPWGPLALKDQLRPELDHVDRELLAELARGGGMPSAKATRAVLRERGFSSRAAGLAVRPFTAP